MSVSTNPRSHALVLLVVLAIVAIVAPQPWYETDRTQYQEIGREIVQTDCSALHCFRPLIPAVLEHLPGPSLLKWKMYAVLANAWAAFAVANLSLALGLSAPVAVLALWLTGLGFGGLFTLFDPYTADPLMFVLGPMLTMWLVQGHMQRSGWVASVGVIAKEFAAAPLWIMAGAAVLARRWLDAARIGTMAFAVTVVWIVLQAALMVGFNNSYGGNPSADIFGGGYIVHWFRELGTRMAWTAIFTELGPLYFMLPLGFVFAPAALKRIVIASIPAVAAFLYVQQPDRAIWNFHFLVTPLAALVLARTPRALIAAFLLCFTVANLRLAAQWQFLPAARYALLLSVGIAVVACVLALRSGTVALATTPARVRVGNHFSSGYRTLLLSSAVIALAALTLLGDMAVHRRLEVDGGFNRQGYRGEVLPLKPTGQYRVAIAGGATAYSIGIAYPQSLGYVLVRFLNQRWRWRDYVQTSVADLSHPSDAAGDLSSTLSSFAHVNADVVCLLTGHNDLPRAQLPRDVRRDSSVFRRTGYFFVLPAKLRGEPLTPAAPHVPVDLQWINAHGKERPAPAAPAECGDAWSAYCAQVLGAVRDSVARGQRVLVVSEPYVSADHFAQQRALAAAVAHYYGNDARVTYLDLGWVVHAIDPNGVIDGWRLTPAGIETFADGLFTGVYEMLKRS